MARAKKGSPRLDVVITDEQYERARQSDSGGCLIADAIKAQYPHLTGITVDMATIRATDKAQGVRFTYLTPAPGQHLLLSFDQGWPNPTNKLTVRGAVKIDPIKRIASQTAAKKRRQTELEAKEAAGESLTPGERRALTIIRNHPHRPTTEGPTEVQEDKATGTVTVRGGRPIPQGPAHPNLLRGRDRHFGAKLADPGQAFREAVDAAVAERLREVATP